MAEQRHGPLSVIHAGLMRTGTLSMKRAYEMLGLRAHHGFEMDSWDDYAGLELAAEATWPSVPGARKPVPPPFTSADWDRLFPNYDVVTDLASLFADEMIRAYPEAKVVVVQRDFDAWWASFASAVLSKDIPGNPLALALVHALYRAAGTRVFDAVSKMVNGAFGTQSYRDITTEKARDFYDAYYSRIRQMVPAERRLEYSLSQGWEPLCRFLDKPIPDAPFPRVNDSGEMQRRKMSEFGRIVFQAGRNMLPYLLGGAGAVLSVWLYSISK
ncbi:uncharacterized protein Bfra_003700 [Botrytis fragariae]|uniref:Efflux pump antibiotic resistance protein n=1 Tax=Botrytis fragariae TaxID=1964551 RepID=A0A8H6AX84_9HELO|nr:uncharacterized protein Bfra_003700 [Botrytis fragariae]KAF5875247.1 hypothetical protein Bfra_003700 [Botrytis fragariae]